MNQKMLAEKLGISETFFSAFLKGDRNLSTKKAVELEMLTKISRNDWLWTDRKELRSMIERWANE